VDRQVHHQGREAHQGPGHWGEEVPVGKGEVDWRIFHDLQARRVQRDLVSKRDMAQPRGGHPHRARGDWNAPLSEPESWHQTKVNIAVAAWASWGHAFARLSRLRNARIVPCATVRAPVDGVIGGVNGNLGDSSALTLGPVSGITAF